MTSFAFRAVGIDGDVVEGELDALDRAGAVAHLHARGSLPLFVDTVSTASAHLALRRLTRGISGLSKTALSELMQRLATLTGGGVAIEDALAIMCQQQSGAPGQNLVHDLLRRLRDGAQLSDSLEAQGLDMPPIVVGMVRAGETSGALPETLARLADYLQRHEAVRQAVRSALIYPAILLATATVSVLIILLVVLPALKPAILDMGGALPLPTRIAFVASDFVAGYWWAIALACVAAVVGVRQAATDPAGRSWRDTKLLRLPLVGAVIRQAEVARFARTLSALLEGGVALPTALGLARPVVTNVVMGDAITQVAQSLREGDGLADPLARSGQFPALAIQLVRIGEATARLGPMMRQLADIFDADVRRALDRGLAILVPVLTIGIGVIVAGLIASVALALLNVNDLIR